LYGNGLKRRCIVHYDTPPSFLPCPNLHPNNELLLFFPIFVERIQMILDFDLANRINQILKEWIKKK
ncbi:hypothetical protein, partial [Butyricimonas virosa]|uniref:hypothetical protein n=1 Tax=Butyricimonas virosa TaxID=544645 RepID=UPI0039F60F26